MRKKFVINLITFLLVIIFGVSIIWPEFSLILENRKNLKDVEEKLAVLTQKSQKIEQLSQELSQNPKNQETVLKYIPISRNEDFLINYLNGIFYAEGIGIRDVALEEKKIDTSLAQAIPENGQIYPEGSLSLQTNLQDGQIYSGESLPLQASPQPVFLTAKFNFFSSYEKITALLGKIDGLKRFNETIYLKIAKTYPEDKKEDATLNFLQVELGLDFNYLKKIASQSEVGEDIFKKEGFDSEVLKNIEEKAVNDVADPESQSDGRSNPFTP